MLNNRWAGTGLTLSRAGRRFSQLLVLLGFGWLLSSGLVLAGEEQPPALLCLHLVDSLQANQLADLDIPIYTRYWDAGGVQFVLLQADAGTRQTLDRLEIPYHLLDPDTRGASYFFLYTPHPLDPSILPENTRVLDTTENFWLLRASPQEMLSLSQSGFEIQRLSLHPLDLPTIRSDSQVMAAITPDPAIQAMIDQVSPTVASSYVGGLSGAHSIMVNDNPYTLYTRYTLAEIPIKKATRYVYEHFMNLGLNSYYDTYDLSGVELRHVIAEQPGKTDPTCVILLVGHLDSTSTDPYNSAPGADDNASGSTGVLIAADILHQYDFACTIRYALFTGEEQVVTYGYFGSKFYADELKALGENVIAVINLDMIGYNSDIYEIIELHVRADNPIDLAIANLFRSVIVNYDINLTTQILADGLSWSDHASFWKVGYPAILAMEDREDFTPYYHKTTDRLSTLNTTYLADFIRAAVGTLAHLAVYIPPEPPPSDLQYFPLILNSE